MKPPPAAADAPTPAGTSFQPSQLAAALGAGMVALMSMGVLPVLLAALAGEHRISDAGIGFAASVQTFAVAISATLAASFLPARRLRILSFAFAVLLGAADLSTLWLRSQETILASRGLAGLLEGLLFWIAAGAIARSSTSERLAGLLLTGATAVSLAASALIANLLLPRYGANGGFALLAVITLLFAPACRLLPQAYPPTGHEFAHRALPGRGVAALGGAALYTAVGMGCFIYLLPLGARFGVSPQGGGQALSVLLAAQLVGGGLASALAGRIGYLTVLAACGVAYLALFGVYSLGSGALIFTAAAALLGFLNFFSVPFLYPLAVDADHSRRSALQSGPAQLLGSAVGPLLAAWVVAGFGLGGVLYLSAALVGLAMIPVVYVRSTRNKPR